MSVDPMAKFNRVGKLGEGTYGIVYKAINTETGQSVALKRIRLESEDEGVPCTAIREISLLKELDHENIVKLYEIVHETDQLTLVFEFCDFDLKKYLDNHNGIISSTKLKSFLYQLCLAVAFCHKQRVLHRDLKPQNLLLKDDVLKLADFGLARGFSVPVRNYSHEVVTLWYRAPEVLLGSQTYSKPIDIWSIGCIFGEMKTGKPMFPGKNPSDELLRIYKGLGSPTEEEYPDIVNLPKWNKKEAPQFEGRGIPTLVPGLDDDGCDLITRMMYYDPSKRVTAQQAMEHPFLAEQHSLRNQKK